MAVSSNCAYARLAQVVGLTNVALVAKRLGITTPIDTVPAMALGTEEVRPIDMAGAYATIANDGILVTPYLVERVVDRGGKEVFRTARPSRRVIQSRIARMTVEVMRDVVRRGTGTAARLDGTQVAGKTGTAQNYEDAWFVGFTPSVATAVWMGAPAAKVPMRNVGGRRVTGGSYPARIWHDYMETAAVGDIESEAEFAQLDDDEDRGEANCLQLLAPKRRSTQVQTTVTKRRRSSCESWGGTGGSSSSSATSTPRRTRRVQVKRQAETEVQSDAEGSTAVEPAPAPVEVAPEPAPAPVEPAPAPVPAGGDPPVE